MEKTAAQGYLRAAVFSLNMNPAIVSIRKESPAPLASTY